MQSPTTLADIRLFLVEQRCGSPPWSTSEATLDGLFGLLVRERESDRFWDRLAGLTRRLQDRQLHRDLISGSDVLGNHTTDDLLRALRVSLRAHQGQRPGVGFARDQRNPQSMAGLVLLGLAVACGGDKADDTAASSDDTSASQSDDSGGSGTDDSGLGDSACQEAADNGITGADSEIFCQLVDLIEASGLSEADKQALLDCLPDMLSVQWQVLLDNWAKMDEVQIEEQMENLANSECESVYDKHHGAH
jgi:hypothetical protein